MMRLRRTMMIAITGACLVASISAAAQEGSRSQDLPPRGMRSHFDHLIKELGSLPFPFEALVARIEERLEPGHGVTTLLVPHGRSLVRDAADFSAPRVLLAVTGATRADPIGGLELILRNRLFIAYAERESQLEVISYNARAGRFEFQLVEGYRPGGTPRIGYARRAFCLSCHQNQGPIFPVRPWRETNANPAVAASLAKALKQEAYGGVALAVPLERAARFDRAAEAANHLVVSQAIWRLGCGDGDGAEARQCRHLLLQRALSFAWAPGRYARDGPAHRVLIDALARQWPKQGIALADPHLRDRDPFAPPDGWRLATWLRGVFGDENKPNFTEELDPLAPRPPKRVYVEPTEEAIFGLAALFSRKDIARLKQATRGDLQTALDVLGGTAAQKRLYGSGPLRRDEVMNLLLKSLEGEVPNSCCIDDIGMSPARIIAPDPLRLSAESDLAVFRTYCFACHRGNLAERLDFMAGRTPEEVWRSMNRPRDIAGSISWDDPAAGLSDKLVMPPKTSIQFDMLQEARQRGEDPLSAMRGALKARGL